MTDDVFVVQQTMIWISIKNGMSRIFGSYE